MMYREIIDIKLSPDHVVSCIFDLVMAVDNNVFYLKNRFDISVGRYWIRNKRFEIRNPGCDVVPQRWCIVL